MGFNKKSDPFLYYLVLSNGENSKTSAAGIYVRLFIVVPLQDSRNNL